MQVDKLIEASQEWPCVVSYCTDDVEKPKLVVAGSMVTQALVEDDFLGPDLEREIVDAGGSHFHDTKLEDLRRKDIGSDTPLSPISLWVMEGGIVNGYIRTTTMKWLKIFADNGWEAKSTEALKYVRSRLLGRMAESGATVAGREWGYGWSSPLICINAIGGKSFGVEGHEMEPEEVADCGGVDLKPGNIDHTTDSMPIIAAIGAINTLLLGHLAEVERL